MYNNIKIIDFKILFFLIFIFTFTLQGCSETSSILELSATTEQTSSRNDEQTFLEDVTIDCVPGYVFSNSEDKCVLASDAYILEGTPEWITYKIQYEVEDYTVYRSYFFLGEDTDIVVDMGDYNGFNYYFSSDTHYNYYLVEKDDEIKNLSEAIEAGWFSLEDMVTQFNILHLQSEEIN